MVSVAQLQTLMNAANSNPVEWQCQANINLYQSPALDGLVTQAAAGRQLRIVSLPLNADGAIAGNALKVQLCEDDYPGWLALEDIDLIEPAETPYQAIAYSAAEIQTRIPSVISFTRAAMQQPNHYLWGGTVGPHYDCSGLMQTAFAAVGIWLPRDSYQQEAFTATIPLEQLKIGDLIFFGTPERTTHVALHLGDSYYIHSSGKDQGRNGIGIDQLSSTTSDPVSQAYYRQFRCIGRVVASYQPAGAIDLLTD